MFKKHIVCKLWIILFVTNISGLLKTNSVYATTEYTIEDLGKLGGKGSEAHGINELGEVVGQIKYHDRNHAFFWQDGVGVTNLGTLGGEQSFAYGINKSRQVVGSANYSTNTSDSHAFLWEKSVGMSDLGTLGGNRSVAYAINELSQVAGETTNSNGQERAFIWEDGIGMTDLGSLGGETSWARDINNSGQVIGYSRNSNYDMHAFLWDYQSGMVDLGTLDDVDSYPFGINVESQAHGINNSGQVVGYSTYDVSGDYHAFLWESGSGMIDLGTLGGNHSYAWDINDSGQILGFSETQSGDWHPFIWKDGIMHDINDFLLNPSNLKNIGNVYKINNSGQIVGEGYFSGSQHALILTPVPEPASMLLFGSGLIGLAVRKKKKKIIKPSNRSFVAKAK